MSAPAERGRALAADLERELAAIDELQDIHAALARAAEHIASGTVALLSLMPFVTHDAPALGFLSDAMDGNRRALNELLQQQHALAALRNHTGTRIDGYAARVASVRAELLDEPGDDDEGGQ